MVCIFAFLGVWERKSEKEVVENFEDARLQNEFWRRASSKTILFTVWVMHVSAPYQNTRCPLNCIEGVSMGSLEALQGNKYKKNMWLLMAGCNWVGFSIWSNLWFLHSLSNGVASLGPKVCWCRELMSEDAGRPFKSMLHEEQKCNTVFESAMGQ